MTLREFYKKWSHRASGGGPVEEFERDVDSMLRWKTSFISRTVRGMAEFFSDKRIKEVIGVIADGIEKGLREVTGENPFIEDKPKDKGDAK